MSKPEEQWQADDKQHPHEPKNSVKGHHRRMTIDRMVEEVARDLRALVAKATSYGAPSQTRIVALLRVAQ